jgi:UDP-N-acetylmuramoyl-tripeptide--D-alanyl-D-alanine ligase
VAAVTGSNGKTTVKEMVAACLRAALRGAGQEEAGVLATAGNLNNDIGLPLTLCRLDAGHRFAVVELGANHPGEIARLAHLARPEVGVVTQCAPAHIEGFGSIEGVAAAKGELFEALPAGGTAVINADDQFSGLWRTVASHCSQLTFGLGTRADVTGRYRLEGGGTRLELATPVGGCEVRVPLPGVHNVMNALAAAAVGLALDLPLEAIARGLAATPTVKGRLVPHSLPGGATLIDDSYNANPTSLAAALAVLEGIEGRRWLVLGDMAELGTESAEFHAEAGRAAGRAGVERILAIGPESAAAVEAFGGCGRHFERVEDLVGSLTAALEPGVTVLVKGSRSMGMERVVSALVARDPAACRRGG